MGGFAPYAPWASKGRSAAGEGEMSDQELIKNPKFWAVWVAIWLGLLLAIENIITKINLLMQLGE